MCPQEAAPVRGSRGCPHSWAALCFCSGGRAWDAGVTAAARADAARWELQVYSTKKFHWCFSFIPGTFTYQPSVAFVTFGIHQR